MHVTIVVNTIELEHTCRHGVLSVPKEIGTEIYDGHWKDGKMYGLGTTR